MAELESATPMVTLGMMLYNEGPYLPAAIQSLQSQTYSDFRLIISDDCSTENPEAVVRPFMESDKRITFHRSKSRMGMIGNYHKTFSLADPATTYFAWTAGHDLYEPEWLETLLASLQSNKKGVVAFCDTIRIDEHDAELGVSSGGLAGRDINPLTLALYGKHFGDKVYGLFRVEALRRAGLFRRLVFPDRLLLLEVGLTGAYNYVPAPLWRRRYVSARKGAYDATMAHTVMGWLENRHARYQRRALFVSPPWYTWLPPVVVHGGALLFCRVLSSGAGTLTDRGKALLLSLALFAREVRFGWVGLIKKAHIKECLLSIGVVKRMAARRRSHRDGR